MKMPWNSVCSFCCCCCCCLEPALGKDIWIRVTSTTVMTIFSKLSLWKLLYHNYVQSFFSTVTRHIDQRILKDTLTVENFTDMDQDTYKFFHQDLSKHHETKINENASKFITCKKIRICTSTKVEPKIIYDLLLYASFSRKQT